MSQKLNDSLTCYVAACIALDADVTGETLADYAECWRRLQEAASEVYGAVGFSLVLRLLDERFERTARAAVVRARKEFGERFGHSALASPRSKAQRKSASDDDTIFTY